ncbi:hypothetical protein KCP70_09010 [Salmonella enterica subsp. enterica]|nr:hypothetical protein KCP70_09010 [Salmonella enterica subsp. enterica]
MLEMSTGIRLPTRPARFPPGMRLLRQAKTIGVIRWGEVSRGGHGA